MEMPQDTEKIGETGVEREALPAAAQRALQEAAARRAELEQAEAQARNAGADERGGPAGKEPTRYGDWERKGRAVDF